VSEKNTVVYETQITYGIVRGKDFVTNTQEFALKYIRLHLLDSVLISLSVCDFIIKTDV
jgi:hypothetical protein